MCWYITSTLPTRDDVARLRPLIEEHGLAFTPLTNRRVQAILKEGEYYARATASHCDCSSSLGDRGNKEASNAREARIRGRRRRGWSDARIARWLAEVEHHGAGSMETDLSNWVAFLRRALNGRQTKYVGLLIHEYSTDLETESIEINGTESVPIALVNEDLLENLTPDVLYRFRASGLEHHS